MRKDFRSESDKRIFLEYCKTIDAELRANLPTILKPPPEGGNQIAYADIADAGRVLEWMRDPNRKPAQLAFTHGPERQAAYWIEIAQSEPEVAANNVDPRFTHRLAIVLECMILNPTRFYAEACALIDEYKAAWEEVNPSPPTFMGEPVLADFIKATRDPL